MPCQATILAQYVESANLQVVESCLLATKKVNQAQVARDMGLTRARVSQLVAEVKPMIRQAVEEARFNTSGGVGNGVKGEANRATPTSEEER